MWGDKITPYLIRKIFNDETVISDDPLNHAVRHLYLWLQGDTSEDHLAHAAWNIFAIMHFEEARPELIAKPPFNDASDH